MTLGKNVPPRRQRRISLDDSADATQLLKIGAPIACPTCGSHTRPADSRGLGLPGLGLRVVIAQ